MTDPVTGETSRGIPAERHLQATRSVAEDTDIAETARNADIMMRTIVGSISADPDDLRRRLENKQDLLPLSEKDVNMRLLILAVALIFLVFGFDLVFLKM
jgi:hypothetical protein